MLLDPTRRQVELDSSVAQSPGVHVPGPQGPEPIAAEGLVNASIDCLVELGYPAVDAVVVAQPDPAVPVLAVAA